MAGRVKLLPKLNVIVYFRRKNRDDVESRTFDRAYLAEHFVKQQRDEWDFFNILGSN